MAEEKISKFEDVTIESKYNEIWKKDSLETIYSIYALWDNFKWSNICVKGQSANQALKGIPLFDEGYPKCVATLIGMTKH